MSDQTITFYEKNSLGNWVEDKTPKIMLGDAEVSLELTTPTLTPPNGGATIPASTENLSLRKSAISMTEISGEASSGLSISRSGISISDVPDSLSSSTTNFSNENISFSRNFPPSTATAFITIDRVVCTSITPPTPNIIDYHTGNIISYGNPGSANIVINGRATRNATFGITFSLDSWGWSNTGTVVTSDIVGGRWSLTAQFIPPGFTPFYDVDGVIAPGGPRSLNMYFGVGTAPVIVNGIQQQNVTTPDTKFIPLTFDGVGSWGSYSRVIRNQSDPFSADLDFGYSGLNIAQKYSAIPSINQTPGESALNLINEGFTIQQDLPYYSETFSPTKKFVQRKESKIATYGVDEISIGNSIAADTLTLSKGETKALSISPQEISLQRTFESPIFTIASVVVTAGVGVITGKVSNPQLKVSLEVTGRGRERVVSASSITPDAQGNWTAIYDGAAVLDRWVAISRAQTFGIEVFARSYDISNLTPTPQTATDTCSFTIDRDGNGNYSDPLNLDSQLAVYGTNMLSLTDNLSGINGSGGIVDGEISCYIDTRSVKFKNRKTAGGTTTEITYASGTSNIGIQTDITTTTPGASPSAPPTVTGRETKAAELYPVGASFSHIKKKIDLSLTGGLGDPSDFDRTTLVEPIKISLVDVRPITSQGGKAETKTGTFEPLKISLADVLPSTVTGDYPETKTATIEPLKISLSDTLSAATGTTPEIKTGTFEPLKISLSNTDAIAPLSGGLMGKPAIKEATFEPLKISLSDTERLFDPSDGATPIIKKATFEPFKISLSDMGARTPYSGIRPRFKEAMFEPVKISLSDTDMFGNDLGFTSAIKKAIFEPICLSLSDTDSFTPGTKPAIKKVSVEPLKISLSDIKSSNVHDVEDIREAVFDPSKISLSDTSQLGTSVSIGTFEPLKISLFKEYPIPGRVAEVNTATIEPLKISLSDVADWKTDTATIEPLKISLATIRDQVDQKLTIEPLKILLSDTPAAINGTHPAIKTTTIEPLKISVGQSNSISSAEFAVASPKIEGTYSDPVKGNSVVKINFPGYTDSGGMFTLLNASWKQIDICEGGTTKRAMVLMSDSFDSTLTGGSSDGVVTT